MRAPTLSLIGFAASGCVSAVPNSQTPLPSIEYFGLGYDILLGNPHAFNGRSDQGFRHPVLKQTYTQNHTIGLNSWLVPDNTFAFPVHACSSEFSSDVIRGKRSYYDSVKSSVEANFPLWGAAFSASTEYKQVQSGTSIENSVYVQALATCSVYYVEAKWYTPPQVTDDFLKGLEDLPETFNAGTASDFYKFLDTFGTHVMSGAEFGGQWGQVSKFSQEAWTNMISSELDISAAATYSGIISAGANVSSASKYSAAQSYMHAAFNQEIFNKGGNYSQTDSEWAASVQNQPMPIHYHLWSLDDVLQTAFMPSGVDATKLASQRQGLQEALGSYCTTLLDAGQVSACSEPGPDPTPAPAVRQWMDWAYDHRPVGKYHFHECPPRAFITRMWWREQNGYGLVDLTVTCSNDPPSSFRFTNNNNGAWNSILACDDGFTEIQAREQWGWGIINAKAQCLGGSTHYASNSNLNGEWKDLQICPSTAEVLVGFEVLEQDRYGIVNYRPMCSNGNLPSRRLQVEMLV